MMWPLLAVAAIDSVTLCTRDARYHTPLLGVQAVDSAGRVSAMSGACDRIAGGTWTLRRIGYHAERVTVASSGGALTVNMRAITDAPMLLATRRVRASRLGGDLGIARTSAALQVDSARGLGISSIAGLVGAMPFVAPRGARGDVGLSLRGARREGVVVTLDGMALNDPSTGTADVSDVPLVLLGSASVSLGADPLGAGPGASGGTLALQTAGRRALAGTAGSFGARGVEGAYQGSAGGGLIAASVSYREAANDFGFVNDVGERSATGEIRERRVNNDERRGAFTLSASNDHAHGLLVVSASDRGMVGPVNVRTYDADRSSTRRALLRAVTAVGSTSLSAGVRALALEYRDPTRPELDFGARTFAGDVDAGGRLRAFAWRIGAGADRVTASGNLQQSRGRAFVAASRSGAVGATSVGAGARVDAIGTFGALPSYSAEARHEFVTGEHTFALGARVAQAVRVPTLYDLYFSSPQRLFVRTLRPERVLLDAEVNGSGSLRTTIGAIEVQGALVARDTRDAIVWFPGNFGFSPQNVGVERLRGAEARVALRPRWATLSAWVTAYDAGVTVGGLRIPTPYVATLAGGGQVAARAFGFTASATVRANGARPFTAGPRNPDFELPPVTVVDAALSRYVPLRNARGLVSLSLDNVAGISWQAVRGFPSPGRSWAIAFTLSPSSFR